MVTREDFIIESGRARDRLRAQEERELMTHVIRQERRNIAEYMTHSEEFPD